MKSNIIAMVGVAVALESEILNAERIKLLEQQLEQLRTQAAGREEAYREKVIVLLTHIEDVVDEANWEKINPVLWNAVTAPQAPASTIVVFEPKSVGRAQ